MQLGQLRTIETELVRLGYLVIAVSPDSPETLSEYVEQNEYNYILLSDSKLVAAKAFGVAFKLDDATVAKYRTFGIDVVEASGETHHMLPVPSVFIIDKDGIVRFVHVNPDYKVRLGTVELLKAARGVVKWK
ncbi:MAG: redoxin domain-containing protein [Candidatus Anammoxibacter sp.]